MLRIRTLVFAITLLFAASVGLRAETVDEVIAKHIQAIGGADAWKKVDAIRLTGIATAQGADMPITMTHVRDKGFRIDLTIMGMQNYQFLTTTEGWAYWPIQGQQKPEAMTADDVKESASDLDLQPLIDYKLKGSTAVLIGKEDVEGTECYKIKFTPKVGKSKTFFIDPSNYEIIRSVDKSMANGQEQDQATDYSNFQKLPEGITVPMNINSPNGPVSIKKVEVNPKIDDAIFKVGPVEVAPGK